MSDTTERDELAGAIFKFTGLGPFPDSQEYGAADAILAAGFRRALRPNSASDLQSKVSDILREHWGAAAKDDPFTVRCMAHNCSWQGRFASDIAEHNSALVMDFLATQLEAVVGVSPEDLRLLVLWAKRAGAAESLFSVRKAVSKAEVALAGGKA